MNVMLRSGLLAVCAVVAPPAAGAFELTPGARLHLDQAWHDADTEPLDDDFLVRRAAVGVDGKFNDDWSFEAGYDFADDGEFKDVYLQYEGWKAGAIAAGQFKVPFGLEELTSSNNTMFIERALPGDAFGMSRRLGIGFGKSGERYTFAAMGFDRTIDEDAGRGAGARVTLTPIDADGSLLHLGAAVTTERPQGEVKFRARPESRPTDTRFVKTGGLDDVSRVNQLGLELAWQRGPFTAQAEWMGAKAERRANPDASFDGWYVAASWMLSGEQRRYKNGAFKGLDAGGSYGAWELTARYSHVDLDDGPVRGGRESNVTLGVNWYGGEHWRIMANVVKVRSDRRGVGDDPAILLVRTQLTF